MTKTRSTPALADMAPSDPAAVSFYDHEHAVTYLRMLDAETAGADWREVTKIVLKIDPEQELARARRAYDSHLSRARWMAKYGYRYFLDGISSKPKSL